MANPFQGDDVDPFSGARDKETGDVKQVGLPASAKTSRFGAAFAAARKAGDKTFEFNGKKYTTEMASEKKKVPAKAAPSKGLPGRSTEGSVSDVVGAKKGGMISSASKRADGIATKGKTRGKMV
jgi:hypothetical protein